MTSAPSLSHAVSQLALPLVESFISPKLGCLLQYRKDHVVSIWWWLGVAFAFREFRDEASLEGRGMLKKEEASLWGVGGVLKIAR